MKRIVMVPHDSEDHQMSASGIRRIDINADLGESYGRWTLGHDQELIPLVSSINVACGFHAGDPNVMLASVALADQEGVGLGAHPGYPDLLGFGRRAMELDSDEIRNYCLYQVGALREIAMYMGVPLQHVKPHGSLYSRVCSDVHLAEAIASALRRVDKNIVLVLLANEVATDLLRKGYRVAREAFADLDYNDDGSIVIERRPQERAPELVAQQALSICAGSVESRSGRTLQVDADTICVHGDRPNAVAIATYVRDALVERNIAITPLGALV